MSAIDKHTGILHVKNFSHFIISDSEPYTKVRKPTNESDIHRERKEDKEAHRQIDRETGREYLVCPHPTRKGSQKETVKHQQVLPITVTSYLTKWHTKI